MYEALKQKYGPGSGRFFHTLLMISVWMVCLMLVLTVTVILNAYVRGNQTPSEWEPAPMNSPMDIQATRARSSAFQSNSLEPLSRQYEPGSAIKLELNQGDVNAWMAVELKDWAKTNGISPRLVNQMEEPHVLFNEREIQLNCKITIDGNVQPLSIIFEPIGGKPVDPISHFNEPDSGWLLSVQNTNDHVSLRIKGIKIGRVNASLVDIIDFLSEHTEMLSDTEKELIDQGQNMTEAELQEAMMRRFGSREAAREAVANAISNRFEQTKIMIPLKWFNGDGVALIEGIRLDKGNAILIMTTVDPNESKNEEKDQNPDNIS